MANNMMAATNALPQVLVAGFLTDTLTTQYLASTAGGGTSVKISNATLTNISGTIVTVSISLVKVGGTAGSSNRVLSAYALDPGDSFALTELAGHVLGPGDFIAGIAGALSSIAFVLSGVVFS